MNLKMKDQKGHQLYEVEKILDQKLENGQKFYLVKWKDYSKKDSTWEPEEGILKNSKTYNVLKKYQNDVKQKVISESVQNIAQKMLKTKTKKVTIDNYGKFETDIPKRIVTHVLTDFRIVKGKVLNPTHVWYKIEWKRRKNGFKPEKSYFKNDTLKQKCSQLFVDYLLKNCILEDVQDFK